VLKTVTKRVVGKVAPKQWRLSRFLRQSPSNPESRNAPDRAGDVSRPRSAPLDKSKRDLAVFTIVQDEPEFIHPWINHYKKHVAETRDLYILVHPATAADGMPMTAEALPAWQRAQALMTGHRHGRSGAPFGRIRSPLALRHGRRMALDLIFPFWPTS